MAKQLTHGKFYIYPELVPYFDPEKSFNVFKIVILMYQFHTVLSNCSIVLILFADIQYNRKCTTCHTAIVFPTWTLPVTPKL